MGKRGFFISIEGGEKAGKTTQAGLLADWLTGQGYQVVLTREPGGTPVGEAVRSILLGQREMSLTPVAEALLFAASRSQLVAEVIRPALEAGQVVVADRFVDSSLAYQAFGLGLSWDKVLAVNEWATGGLWPDLTFLLDCPASHDFSSRPREGAVDRIEKRQTDFHDRTLRGFRRLAEMNPDRYVVLDGSEPRETVAEAIRKVVTSRMYEGR